MPIVVLDVLHMSGNHFAYLAVPAVDLATIEEAVARDLGHCRFEVRMSSWDAVARQVSVIIVPKIRMQLGICFDDRIVFLVDAYVSASYSLEDCYQLVYAWPGIGERISYPGYKFLSSFAANPR